MGVLPLPQTDEGKHELLIFGGLIHFSFTESGDEDELTNDVFLMTIH
jgi:hypothetical protein